MKNKKSGTEVWSGIRFYFSKAGRRGSMPLEEPQR
jgi:hypothetical protein